MHRNDSKQKGFEGVVLICIMSHSLVISSGCCEEQISPSTNISSVNSLCESDEEIQSILDIKQRLANEISAKAKDDLARLYELHDLLIDKIDLRGIVLNTYTLSQDINTQAFLTQAHLLLMGRNRLISKDIMIFELNMLRTVLSKFYESNVQDYLLENVNKYRCFRSFDMRLIPEKLHLLCNTFAGDSTVYNILGKFKIDLHSHMTGVESSQREFILHQIYRYSKTALRKCIIKVKDRIYKTKKPVALCTSPYTSHTSITHPKPRSRPNFLDDSDLED